MSENKRKRLNSLISSSDRLIEELDAFDTVLTTTASALYPFAITDRDKLGWDEYRSNEGNPDIVDGAIRANLFTMSVVDGKPTLTLTDEGKRRTRSLKGTKE